MKLAQAFLPIDYQPAVNLLDGRVALVTGAGQGLGKVAALAFAQHGASVILHGRNVPKLEALYDEIVAAGFPQPAILPLDYLNATQAELDAYAQAIQTTFSRLDIMFHGASHFVSCMPLELHNLDMWQQHARIHLAVPAAMTKACMPLLKRAPDASVIYLTETHAVDAKAFWGAFAATKSALASLTAIWADEMEGQTKVRFNLCLPGPVASPMRNKSHPGEVAAQLRPAESLARYFLYLAGADSAFLSGAQLDCREDLPMIP
ncbi:MAG: SDR family NAD(P)-dependent oxidoreductase [Burkholderiales bacterium]|nr:SDR family NAD(P)-dependent oxidoreductase [Burkholderiales bacterium]